MAYLIWSFIGVVIAMVLSATSRRYALSPSANASVLAGIFGALIGGVIGDGVPHALAGTITLASVLGATLGALLFCWAARGRAEDTES